ncbi:MAG: lipid II flippase MurJ, partial [Acidimicrobiales bacterium]
MAAGTMASRLTGLARLAVLAGVLGYTGLADAYNLANTTPNIVYDLVAGGVLSATVLPVFVDRLTRRPGSEGWGDIGAVVSLATVVLVVVSALFALVAPEIIHLYELD